MYFMQFDSTCHTKNKWERGEDLTSLVIKPGFVGGSASNLLPRNCIIFHYPRTMKRVHSAVRILWFCTH